MNSIAIVGASANHEKFGNKCVRAYKKLGWIVYPINPKEKIIENLKCYSTLPDLPLKPTRISIYLPAEVTISIIPDLLKIGAKEVILNPGAGSEELINALKENKISPKLICSIRTEGLFPEDFP